ncbi:PREDICTED: probable protein phosphatase 2C 14 isoform X1 [Ipomoea nil]|uniref:probable protein phosphatase 2C 14 isoform X1 n=1 Tax=Ipomoea nil TaxID=35883 RepID=UPI0009009CA7|nr:PREDICTED: probable protein phosphatase 2C 14 isoform X1 [Ipomoea nil]
MDSGSLKRKRPPMIEIPNVLREISAPEEPRACATAAQDDAVWFSAKGVGVFSLKGRKKFMEDTHKIVCCPHAKKGFFGVYDGHGGSKAAEFVAENLHSNILDMLKNSPGSSAKEDAIMAGYLKTDSEFLKKGICSGACCVTALVEGEEIIVSNLGDCRAVLCRSGVAEVLTRDHRAGQEDERRRIEDKGGYVEIHRGAWRVHGVLSVSRSIGDAHLKDWVVAEPDTKRMCLTADMQYLVLASDGLWDKVENQEAIDMVMQSCQPGPKDDDLKENVFEFDCISTSPSSKLKRISLVKSNKGNESDFGTENGSPAQKSLRISLAKSSRVGGYSPCSNRSSDNWKETDDEFSRETETPLKARRISLAHSSIRAGCSPCSTKSGDAWKETDDEFSRENESPLKARRISLANSSIRAGCSPRCKRSVVDSWKENEEKSALVDACKKLASLAVTKGSLDDVTVMIIDLAHFKNLP